jgi:uncharacterized membrane protein YbhN (UPF0104 family)
MLEEDGRRSTGGETRRRYLRWGRIAVTVAAVAYLASRVEPRDVLNAFQRLSVGAALTTVTVVLFGLVCGMVRWRLLLRAYGAIDMPSWPRIAHLYMVGHFYNTYAPGGVGGDVIRGVASRKSFGDLHWASATSGVAVVMPLIGASAFVPFTVGGAGVREAAFAALYGTVGVPEASAYAASLGLWGTLLFSAALGGVLNLFIPLSGGSDD